MSIYTTLIGTIAGICLGFALLFFFVGIRRRHDKRLNLLFALFAFSYTATLLLGTVFRSRSTVEAFISVARWDGVFIWLAFVALNWYVAEYTQMRNRTYLWGITAMLTVSIAASMLNPTLTFLETPTLVTIALPWQEEIAGLAGEENVWGALLLLSELTTLSYVLIAGARQWRRQKRHAAAVLLGGMSWFIIALLYEIGGEIGLWIFLPLAETGFLGIAVALALQMANSVIRTEEALTHQQNTLEEQVDARTAEVQEANRLLLEQERITAAEDERRRLAGELHDSVTQTLYSVSLVAAALPRLLQRNADEARLSVTHLRNMTLGALAEMRTLLYELRPEAFEGARLSTLLQQAADVFTGQTNVPVELSAQADPQLSTETKRALYRITQEALNNTAKHAAATQTQITLSAEEGRCILCVKDNGRGFDPAAAGEGMGLKIMRERAQQAGVELDVASSQNEGTIVTARIGTQP